MELTLIIMQVVTDLVVCYIIKTKYNTYYTGITNNLIRRWSEHKEGKSSYLSVYKPKEVVFCSPEMTRKEAAQLERFIKSIGALKFLRVLHFKNTNYHHVRVYSQ
jgi:putative endonuclease